MLRKGPIQTHDWTFTFLQGHVTGATRKNSRSRRTISQLFKSPHPFQLLIRSPPVPGTPITTHIAPIVSNFTYHKMQLLSLLTTADNSDTIATQRAEYGQKAGDFVNHLRIAVDNDTLTDTSNVSILRDGACSILDMLNTLHPSIDPTEFLNDETDLFTTISYLSRATDYIQTNDTRLLLKSLKTLRSRLLEIKRKIHDERKRNALQGLASEWGKVKACVVRLGSRTLDQEDLEQMAAAMKPATQHGFDLRYILSPDDKQKLGWDKGIMELFVARLGKLPQGLRVLPVFKEFEWQVKMLERML
ncbi:hypothetical protein K491DRAFT_690785 [Lophiostoma macrostomum CBS 122681]|uniref:Uncharacterized protein n=1 Tax=Lophiostoma macrostomum CBS 122681 TaxID=1314788 RepID=A0A6A6TGG7_9PLEO|nr:hypothetical protein K491DRAFT_690785 [Lophiostoma macrostomum CBS 122681]